VTATPVSATQVNLTWTAASDNVGVTGYQVERCQGVGCTTFAQLATPTGTSYSDPGLTAATSYSYRVKAVDAAGNVSVNYSNVASATTPAPPDTTPPSDVTGVTATAVSATQINLTWTAASDNVGVTGYQVERCQGAGCTTFAQLATPTGTGYSDPGLTAATSYSYRVKAVDAAGNVSVNYSNVASATTPAPDVTPPTAPGNLTATSSGGSQINLSWTPATDNVGVTGYLVERRGGGTSTFVQVGTSAGTTFTDTGLTPGTTYTYRVRATDGPNTGPYSNEASATTRGRAR
jgi:chitodextrinase